MTVQERRRALDVGASSECALRGDPVAVVVVVAMGAIRV